MSRKRNAVQMESAAAEQPVIPGTPDAEDFFTARVNAALDAVKAAQGELREASRHAKRLARLVSAGLDEREPEYDAALLRVKEARSVLLKAQREEIKLRVERAKAR